MNNIITKKNLKGFTLMSSKLRGSAGFTLIELLIVIAILGTLAVVVLLALNPVQQLARTRDAGRISGVTQLGHAIEANATTANGQYLTASATWITSLKDAGEIASVPSAVLYTAPGSGSHPAAAICTNNQQSQICYRTFVTGAIRDRAIVYTRLESGAQNNRCPGASQAAWAVYSTANASGGVLCTADQSTEPGDPTTNGYSGNNWLQ